MAITRFRPEIWSAQLLVGLRKSLVYGGPGIVNRDYEGEIRQAGDTVRITSISDPTINDYVANSTTIVPETLTDAQRTLLIDQCKYFAFEVDDVDARQAIGNVIPEAMSRAAYKLADIADQFIAGLYTGVQSANIATAVTSIVAATDTTWHLAYDAVLVPLKVVLDEANVPTMGRYVVIPPWLHGIMLRDPRFVRVDESGTSEGLRNGQVGRAAGFDILLSNNVPVNGAVYTVQAGISTAITMAEQINKTEAYRPQDSFGDAVKGLALYGAKLIRPDCIATCAVTKA